MKGYFTMSVKEADRIAIMDKLIEKRIKQKHAAFNQQEISGLWSDSGL